MSGLPTSWSAGTQIVTADSVIGTSGATTRVFCIHIISTGTAAVVSLRNGIDTTGTIYLTQTGTINTGATFEYGTHGFNFPAGCFVDVDANTTSVTVEYSQ